MEREKILLYKRIQRVPLRSTLNIALFDMRKLEYDIRRTIVSADRLMSANVLKDHYVEELMLAKRTEVFTELVPRKYRRSISPSPYSMLVDLQTHTPTRPLAPPATDRPSRTRTPRLLRTSCKSNEGIDVALRRSADIISLQLKCRKAKQSVKMEKRSVNCTNRRVMREYGRCSEDLERVMTGVHRRDVDAETERSGSIGCKLRETLKELRRKAKEAGGRRRTATPI